MDTPYILIDECDKALFYDAINIDDLHNNNNYDDCKVQIDDGNLPELQSKPDDLDEPEQAPSGTTAKKEDRWGNRRRQITILVLLSLSSTSLAESISIFPPFYPRIAEEKGSSATMYGFVLGSNSLVMFLATPWIGKKVKSVGMKFAFTLGMFINGTCCILSGFLNRFHGGAIFVLTSIAIRIVHALGNAAVVTSSFAIMGTEFPDSVARVFGLTRIFLQVGFLIGPIIGGGLYQMGGYSLPFIVLGGIHCTVALLTLVLHPGDQAIISKTEAGVKKCVTISAILQIPGIWIAFGCFVVSTFTNGFLTVTLEPEVLRQFTLSPLYIGIIFAIKDGINGISAPFWGWFCDKTKAVKPFIVFCAVTSGCSLLLLDHPIGVSRLPALLIIVVGLILNGIGTSGEQVIAILDSLRHILEEGHPDDPDIHGCIAGLWSSLSGLGRFLSRSLIGILVDRWGHSTVTVIVSCLNLFLALATIIFLCVKSARCRSWGRTNTEESEPLLSALRN